MQAAAGPWDCYGQFGVLMMSFYYDVHILIMFIMQCLYSMLNALRCDGVFIMTHTTYKVLLFSFQYVHVVAVYSMLIFLPCAL